jgi:hypothetical protein
VKERVIVDGETLPSTRTIRPLGSSRWTVALRAAHRVAAGDPFGRDKAARVR